MIVHVLGFSYLKCKTYREREYSREFADITPSEPTVGNKKTVGVLCSYYGWSKEGLLTEVNGQPCYVNIDQCKKSPYMTQFLKIINLELI